MRVALILLLGLVAALVVVCYALCVIAHDADERAERMYRMWKESKGNDND